MAGVAQDMGGVNVDLWTVGRAGVDGVDEPQPLDLLPVRSLAARGTAHFVSLIATVRLYS
jgi:hypothetical protein